MSPSTQHADPLVFPYVYTTEVVRPRYWRNRAEGRPLWDNLLSTFSYLRKYHNPKTSAPVEEVRYFDHQRQLLRYLAGRAAATDSPRLAMVGDIMGLVNAGHSFLDPAVLGYLNGFDAVLGNLETVISPRFKVPSILPDSLIHNADPALLTSFRRPAGRNTFTALATANNHSVDYGDAGLSDTLDFLDGQGILHSGVRRNAGEPAYATFTVGGLRVGFYAASWGFNNAWLGRRSRLRLEVVRGLAPRVKLPVDLAGVHAALAGMTEEKTDIKVVHMHWGHEYEFYPTPELMRVGREIIGAGADIVFGSHPHVVQPLEICLVNGYEQRYRSEGLDLPALAPATGCLIEDGTGVPRKGLVAYSLGNFTTASYFAHTQIGLVLGVRFVRDVSTGRIDWEAPSIDFVCNVHRHPVIRSRRLVLLERYLLERRAAGDNAAHLRPTRRFLRRHVLGGV